MQPSDNAFNRVKSLLGKLDRSIDDARRRRLTDEPEEAGEPGQALRIQTETDQIPAESPQRVPPNSNGEHDESPRASSKYGRARPIRELPGSSASWQTV